MVEGKKKNQMLLLVIVISGLILLFVWTLVNSCIPFCFLLV